MKNKLTLLLALFFSLGIFAQSPPEAINYQAVARSLSGVPLVNQSITVEYSILQGSSSGTVVYSETHAETTNQFGLFTSEVGMGTVTSGNFSAINWGGSTYYLQVKVGGDVMPATQLLSVPYALHANTAENVTNDMVDDADADPDNEIQDLQLLGNILTITNNGTATSIDLSGYLDNTDTQLDETAVDAFV